MRGKTTAKNLKARKTARPKPRAKGRAVIGKDGWPDWEGEMVMDPVKGEVLLQTEAGQLRRRPGDGGVNLLPRAALSTLAGEQGLSVYVAAHLELAVRRKLPPASRDQALCQAAQNCRVKLLL